MIFKFYFVLFFQWIQLEDSLAYLLNRLYKTTPIARYCKVVLLELQNQVFFSPFQR
jgi:hypothetical protein